MIRRSCRDLIAIAAWMLRAVHFKQPAAAILFLLLFPQLVLGAAIRIMPLGDSITVGSDSGAIPDDPHYYVSYRKALKESLASAGYLVDFVGGQLSGDWVPNFDDPQHEGHGGWFADGPASSSILPNVDDFLSANHADIILLHIGTNDINVGQDAGSVASEVEDILNAIDGYEQSSGKEVWVVLARIVNRATGCPYRAATTSLNDFVDQMAQTRRQALYDKIVVVDIEHAIADTDYGIHPNGDMFDCLHPYATGNEKLAAAWLQGLLEILPVADAGDDQDVNPNDLVTLDGSGSTDALGTIISYAWVQTDGSPTVTLTSVPSPPPAPPKKARFTAPDTHTGATLTFELTITDDKGFTHSDSCVVNVNGAPTADAGPDQRVKAGTSVVLDGSNSNDADGGIVDYEWVQTAGLPVGALANAKTAKASFSAPAVGSGGAALSFRLTVTDDKGADRSDTCVVNVNGPPVADAGTDQIANPDAPVVLDGSKSEDADGSVVSYQWVQTAGLPVGDLANANTSHAGFTAPDVGSGGAILTFRLTVTDDLGVQSSDTVNVQINGPPAADAGPNQQVQSGANVTLDGSGSTDGDDGALVYAWIQTSGPAVALSGSTSLRPSFQAPSAGSTAVTLSFLLTVTDSGGLQSEDSCTVTVTPPGESSQSGSGGGGGGGGCFITAAGQ